MTPRAKRILAGVAGVAAVTLAIVGVVQLTQGSSATEAAPASSVASSAPAPSEPAPSSAAPSASASAAAPVGRNDAGIGAQPAATVDPPVAVRVDDIDLDLGVIPVGVREDGQMDVPLYVGEVGWYEYGPAPGADAGSAVLCAHVDSEVGAAPMAALFDAQPGSTVEVETASGQTLAYRIETVEQLGKETLPLDELFARDGAPVLRLVTCAGDFDPVAQAYEDNLVVTAVPISS